jgi:hypothetical protein
VFGAYLGFGVWDLGFYRLAEKEKKIEEGERSDGQDAWDYGSICST